MFENNEWYEGIPKSAKYGKTPKGDKMVPAANVVIAICDGPLKGKELEFNVSKWSSEQNVHTFRKLRACGWKGERMGTLESDVKEFAASDKKVKFQARLAEHNGSTWWTVNDIKSYSRVIVPASSEDDAMMDEMIAEAAQSDAEYRANRGGGSDAGNRDNRGRGQNDYDGYGTTPPISDNDLPF